MTSDTLLINEYSRRSKAIESVSKLFEEISFMSLSEKQFSTSQLEQLGLYSKYSIPPIYGSVKLFLFYKKLSEFYWNHYSESCLENQARTSEMIEVATKEILDQNKSETQISQNQLQIDQNEQITDHNEQIHQQNEQNQQQSIKSNQEKAQQFTEAINKDIECQQNVSKNYNQIKWFITEFDNQKCQFSDNLKNKIKILNSWTTVSCLLPNFISKKSGSEQQSLKIGKKQNQNSLKSNLSSSRIQHNSGVQQSTSRKIILGKNESTQTRQMKHILKIQSKVNFVEEKKKQESELNILDQKSIQLNYLLNVITKQYFQDFSNDILYIIQQNNQIIDVFCDKIEQKIMNQHNYIQIYVQLVKKLCNSKIQLSQQSIRKPNILQRSFITHLQQKFLKLINQQIIASIANQSQYKYQKQVIGMCTFIGKLMHQSILSNKIFKVCFWEICYAFMKKIKQNPQNQIVNQVLLQGIVIIQQHIGQEKVVIMLHKQKLKSNQYIDQNTYEQMIQAWVNSDSSSSQNLQNTQNLLNSQNLQNKQNQQRQCQQLIDNIKISEYPSILMGIMQIFQSKRLKLKFLLESWSQKISKLSLSQKIQQNLQKHYEISKQNKTQKTSVAHELIRQFIIRILQRKDCLQFDTEPKSNTQQQVDFNNIFENLNRQIKKQIQNQSSQFEILSLLISEYIKNFADSTDKKVIHKRIKYFFDLLHFYQSIKQVKSCKSNKTNQNLFQIALNIICIDKFDQLMIIQCDYPFFVEGLAQILYTLAQKVNQHVSLVLNTISKNLDPEDQDITDFLNKVQKKIKSYKKVQN